MVGAALRLALLTNEPLLDNMGANGEITMTNLKSATGIADDRLSAHHPNGAGNTTGMGNFLVSGVQRSFSNSSRLLLPHKVKGSTSGFSGSYDTTDPATALYSFDSTTLAPPDTFTIQIAIPFAGEHFAQQIASRSQNLSFSDNDNVVSVKSIDLNPGRGDFIDYTLEMTGYGLSMELAWTFADGMNTDAVNYNSTLFFRTQDIEQAIPRIALEDGDAIGFEDSYDGNQHDYSINSGNVGRSAAQVLFDLADNIDEANATWELYFNGSLEATTSGDPAFSVTKFLEGGSGGDNWELHLIDSSGTFVDAVVWSWGDSQNPYANSGQTLSATFGDRQDDNQASGPNNPVTLLE